mmetsp:Transcript_11945/g.24662  ORF Transcript_11945/g.24662 Transcript_11945/m.24662 type:complete len:89 (-) Transcript_11945:1131-1397(-)
MALHIFQYFGLFLLHHFDPVALVVHSPWLRSSVLSRWKPDKTSYLHKKSLRKVRIKIASTAQGTNTGGGTHSRGRSSFSSSSFSAVAT